MSYIYILLDKQAFNMDKFDRDIMKKKTMKIICKMYLNSLFDFQRKNQLNKNKQQY